MKVLVTGGTGFIGASVVKNLLARGLAVVAADVNPNPQVAAGIAEATIETMDVADAGAVASVFARNPDITHCIHLAYLMSAEVEANPALGVSVNVLGMVNMFEAALRHRLARLVFTSSETVYGASQARYGERPVTEDDFCAPARSFLHLWRHEAAQRVHGAEVHDEARRREPRLRASARGLRAWAQARLGAVGRGFRFQAGDRGDGAAAVLAPLARDLDLQGRLRRATGAPRAEAEARAFRLQQRRRLRVGRRRSPPRSANGCPKPGFEFDETKPRTPLIDWQDGQTARARDRLRAAPARRRRARPYQRGAPRGGPPGGLINAQPLSQHRRRQLSAPRRGRRHDEEADARAKPRPTR